MTLISLHLPKTGGTSFKASLEAHFAEQYQNDYDDQPISQSRSDRYIAAGAASEVLAERGLGSVKCVHGHFLPAKYLLLGYRQKLTFVTWMREPISRLLSHYYYWQETYDVRTAAPHHRQVIEEAWTLEQFCLSEQFRNIYTQYLWGFPVENFAFIGITEHYREDLLEFSERFLSDNLKPHYLNPTKYSRSHEGLQKVFLDKVLNFHAADVQLYRRVLQWREVRHSNERRRDLLLTTRSIL